VRFVVPLPPGGSPDLMARTIASGLSGTWPQQIVVDNRPGAHHNLAADIVARSAPDGYTWLLTTDNILVVNPHLEKLPFDPFRDFAPVTQIAQLQFLLVVHPSVPAKSVPDLVALAKAKPGALLATRSAARLWCAPGRLSTTICCGQVPDKPVAMVRAMRSGEPPGGSGTTNLTGRRG